MEVFRRFKNYIFMVLAATFVVFGCSAKNEKIEIKKEYKQADIKSINSIDIEKQPDTILVIFKSDKELIYSAVKEREPDAIVFYFPDTMVKGSVSGEFPIGELDNIKVSARNNDSKVKLIISGDLPYLVEKEGLNLIVKVKSVSPVKEETLFQEEEKEEIIEEPEKKTAEILKNIEIMEDESLNVMIHGDGIIKAYKAFTLKNPPRIVLDIKGLASSHKKMKKKELKGKWGKSLRYFGNNERLRIVIDTKDEWLEKYRLESGENSLNLIIGAKGKSFDKKKAPGIKKVKPIKQESLSTIDFLAMDNGRCKVAMGLSGKSEYEIDRNNENEIILKFLNTRIPSYHQRPIITKRFDCAVDGIYPVYDEKINKKDSLVIIKMREQVAFTIDDESSSGIEILFEASSKSGEKEDKLNYPQWKKVLSEKTEKEVPEKKENFSAAPEAPAKISEVKKEAEPEFPAQEKPVKKQKDKEKKYSGQKITLDFYETDIKNVFRILQHVSGLNFAIDKDVKGKVTMTLKQPVPWDQVLDLILKMNSLGMQKEGNIVRIANHSTLEEEEARKKEMLKARKESQEQEKSFAPLFTEYLLINYSDAETEILPHLEGIISKRGSLSVDKRNNQIILTETDEIIEKAKQIITQIDKITPQVVIEARIVEASTNFTKDIGTEWGASTNVEDASKYASIYKEALGGKYGYNISMNTQPSAENGSGSIGINFARIAGTPFILNAKINAMVSEKKGKIISAPKIVTLDNKKATIKQGVEYPYVTLEDGETKTEFKNIDLQLDVTPHVTADNKISMKVKIDKNDIAETTANGPALSTKKVETELLVNDGDTIVIGGIIQKNEIINQRRFPLISQIPVMGWFFKSNADEKRKNELLIFLTPRIVELEQGKY